ncbi:glucose 1-dehydrogenase [Viridibacillus sp. FSL R5-0477]|uniref:Short-chain dehydrogenase/reductase SDR n=1 Tax=Viridibacillus arenosi FSL R5-213 TaxID=1227360 RepID=W4F1M8_9BACL|nr:glucose 1-dehydrogenase [Viridibacillus arenosi]ETT86680.1 short-chain dehydrogenase/reductase SDR [Viridibacillus arenosi FSL R5-213]OMC89549.1 short-chain dehydrogenase [Viridibacillus arenosi]
MRLQGKVAIITGAGSGIGRATAERFAQEGAHVVINDVNREAGKATVEIIRSYGGSSQFIFADVTNESDFKLLVDQVVSEHSKIDILFNNAGVSGVGNVEELDVETWDRVMSINVKGVFIPSKCVVPHMKKQQSGSIINMSSCVAEMGLMRRTVYSASKGAVLAFTKSMQVDYAKYNIRVNALLPGTIMTPFVEDYLRKSYDDPEEAFNTIRQRQLTAEIGLPLDVASAALFLASDDSKFVMGSPLYVDGGVVFGKNA